MTTTKKKTQKADLADAERLISDLRNPLKAPALLAKLTKEISHGSV